MQYKISRRKIWELRALHKRYCKVTGSKTKLNYQAKATLARDSGWWLDGNLKNPDIWLGDHVAQAYPVLDEMLTEYQMSVGKDER